MLNSFIHKQKGDIISKEKRKQLLEPLYMIMELLKTLKKLLSPPGVKDGESFEEKKSSQPTFVEDLTKMFHDSFKPISQVKNIFEAMFLERKLLLIFLNYSKILEETGRIVCLLLVLLSLRVKVLNQSEGSMSLQAAGLNTSYDGSMTTEHRTESDNKLNQSMTKGI